MNPFIIPQLQLLVISRLPGIWSEDFSDRKGNRISSINQIFSYLLYAHCEGRLLICRYRSKSIQLLTNNQQLTTTHTQPKYAKIRLHPWYEPAAHQNKRLGHR